MPSILGRIISGDNVDNQGGEFEIQVRRIGRHLWPSARVGNAQLVDGNEIDGIFVTDDIVYAIEATIERTKKKVESDYTKLELKREYFRKTYPDHVFRAFIVTRDEPTAQQLEVIPPRRSWVKLVSFRSFFSRLVDADQYMQLRNLAPFGSAADPFTGSKQLADTIYIATPFRDRTSGQNYSVADCATALMNGGRLLVAGDFGVGKSFGLREIYNILVKRYVQGETFRFPVFLNLRDHQGQVDPDEVLARHARRIGFDQQQLVRAWRSDCLCLILDGFDELVASGWSDFIRTGADARRSACEVIRKFVSESASLTPIAVSGRESYFDSATEMIATLGASKFTRLNLDEFSATQAIEFVSKTLKVANADIFLPTWLPHKPLLLGYCAAKGVLAKAQAASDSIIDEGEGWNWLLDQISIREAETSSGVDPAKVRELIERIALRARQHLDHLGSIDIETMERSFGDVFGKLPDPQVRQILDRMPGLTWGDSAGTRRFIDELFFSAAQAGAVFQFVQNPHQTDVEPYRNTQQCIASVGARVAYDRCKNASLTPGGLLAAADVATSRAIGVGNLIGDLLQVLLNYEEIVAPKSRLLSISGAYFENLEIDPELFRNVSVHFDNCLFSHLALGELQQGESRITFSSCEIDRLICSPRTKEIWEMFSDKRTTIGTSELFSTTNDGIMHSALPLGFRILKTILRKLFQQTGSGRVEGALFRGLGVPHDQIRDILELVRQHGLASPNYGAKSITWHPNRRQASRANALIDAFKVPDDILARSATKHLPDYPKSE